MGIGARSLQDLQTQFTGELQVKLILTGLAPNIADLAKLPPIWATGGSRSVFFFCVAASCKLHCSHLGMILDLADIMCDPALVLCKGALSPLDVMVCTSPGLQRVGVPTADPPELPPARQLSWQLQCGCCLVTCEDAWGFSFIFIIIVTCESCLFSSICCSSLK